jgi:hypothetical protein
MNKPLGTPGLGTSFALPRVGPSSIVPMTVGGGRPPVAPPSMGHGGGGGGLGQANSNPCPPGCGCHPLWYVGSAVGVMMILSLLLARK